MARYFERFAQIESLSTTAINRVAYLIYNGKGKSDLNL